MTRKSLFSSIGFLIVGTIFFLFGLLMILQQTTIVSSLSPILPGTQSIQIFGVVIQFLGEILLIFATVRTISNRFLNSMQNERQALVFGFTQHMERMQTERKALMDSFAQTMERVDNIISNQRLNTNAKSPLMSSECRFCGAKIEQGDFCPKCGRAQV